MSIFIFFGFALLIFLAGMTVLSVTFYHWYKLARDRKSHKNSEVSAPN